MTAMWVNVISSMLKVLPTGIFQKTLADGRCPGCDISVCMIYLNCGVSCYSNHIGVGSNVVCSTLIGNARASTCGMDNTEVHAFLCLFVSKNLENTMSTLFNVTHQGECSPPRNIGLASNIPPPQPVRERLFWDVSHRAEPLSRLHLSPSKGIYFFILKFCFMLNNSS